MVWSSGFNPINPLNQSIICFPDVQGKEIGESHILLCWSEVEQIRDDDEIEYIVQKLHQDHDKELMTVGLHQSNRQISRLLHQL